MDLSIIDWTKDRDNFIDYLYSLKDEKYKEFSKALVPGEFTMIGIRFPLLKSIAKEIAKTDYDEFLKMDDGQIFELRLLKGFTIANIKDLTAYKERFTNFIQLIDNWSICDSFIASSKIIGKNRSHFFEVAKELLADRDEFKNRIAFVMLLDHFVVDDYIDGVFTLITGYKNDKYYANMALAWLLCELYIKYPERTKIFWQENNFDEKVTKYTIRKIKDSYRVSKENKEWLKKIG